MTTAEETRDEDRLPWLETVEDDREDAPNNLHVIGYVILGLLVIAGVIFAMLKLQGAGTTRPASGGSGGTIAAPAEPYKVKPQNPGGMKVEGTGDVAFAASQGKDTGNGSINLGAVPEAPVEGKHVTAPANARHAANGTVPAVATPLKPAAPVKPPVAPAVKSGGGGSLVQLGAFPSEAAANGAWTAMAKRFAYLAPLGKAVQRAEVGGKTTYRLRVNAGSADQAEQLCGKLKVAGEACFVAKN